MLLREGTATSQDDEYTHAELQELCTASADALGDKKACYTIDPQDTMLPVLLAASSVGELERAWRLLIQRISRAQEKLERNFLKAKKEEVPPSPATTDPVIYENLQNTWDAEEVMTHLYQKVPSMAKMLTNDESQRFDQGKHLRSALASPIALKAAFPDRSPEARPTEVYYNEDGARIHATDPDSLIPRRSALIPPVANRVRFNIAPSIPTNASISSQWPS